MKTRRDGRSCWILGFFLITMAWTAPFAATVHAQAPPPPIAPPGEQMSPEEIAYWESSVPCPPGPDGLQLTGASYTGNMLPSVSIACTYTDPADATTTYEITVEWNKPQSGLAYYCNDSDNLTQVAVGTHDGIIRLEPFDADEARLAALAEAAAPLRDWVAGVADECPAKIPCPPIDGVSAPYEPNAAYFQQEGNVLIFGSNTRNSTLSMATCSYSSAEDGETSEEGGADGASIEVFWANQSTTDLDRQRPCLLEETFRNGIGTVTLGGQAAAYAVYAISAMEPVDPAPFEAAARTLLSTVAPQAATCEGIEALETETPLPGNLAAAFDAAVVAGGDDEATPPADSGTPPPSTVTSTTTSSAGTGGDNSEWYTWPLRLIGIAAMALSIITLVATFALVRRATLIHPMLDIARVVVITVVALIMLSIFSATAPVWAVVVAIVAGAALGFWQGDHLVVRHTARGMSARRTGWAVVAFGAGIVLTQVAGYLDRAGVITLGIALSFLSGAIAAGLIVGRRPRIADAKRAAATTTTVLLLAFVVGTFATVDKTEAQDDDPDVVLPEERAVGDDALIDLVDWNNVKLRTGLFADSGKPFQVVPTPRALDTAPNPATFTTAWTYDDGSGLKQYSATETHTFGLRPDGLCCTVDYSGTGTVTDAAGAVSSYEAAGRLDDIQSVAVEGSPGAPVRIEAVGTPFTAPQSFAEPGAAVPAGVDTDPAACGRIVGETRSPFDLEETGGLGELSTYTVDGQPSTAPEGFGGATMITDCNIEGFTTEAGLALAPPPPPIGDVSREGGCPVFQELIGDLAPASRFAGVDTSTTAQTFLSPNAEACTTSVTFGQEGPGGTRHELVYSLARPADPAYGTESTWVDEDYWNDLPQPYEFPPESRCAVDANGAPIAPADQAVGCSLMTRHEIGETKVAIWTDWTLIEGPNVLVFVTAPWGSYVYRCHHCTPTDPAIAEFLAALNGFTADATAQIAEVSASAPADVSTDTPAEAPADGTDADATKDSGDDSGGVEEAPLVGLVGLAGAASLYLLSRAEGDELVDDGQQGDGQRDGQKDEDEPAAIAALLGLGGAGAMVGLTLGELSGWRASDAEGAGLGVESPAGNALGFLNNLQSFDDSLTEYRGAGYDPHLATLFAALEVLGGNAAGDSAPFGGIADSRLEQLSEVFLPAGVRSALVPSEVVKNDLRTGLEALTAVAETLGGSWDSDQWDTTPLDRFVTAIEERPGADPFAGYSQAFGLCFEELYTDGGVALAQDLTNLLIGTTDGASPVFDDPGRVTRDDFSEALLEGAAQFRDEVAGGKHGVVLQGLDDVFGITADLVTDPMEAIGGFVDDMADIVRNGVGDGYWTDVAAQVDSTLREVPVVKVIYSGYQELFRGVVSHADSADDLVTGAAHTDFAIEMAEGAAALGAEVIDFVQGGDNAVRAYDYLRSLF